MEDDTDQQPTFIADPNMTDEMKIGFTVDEFYEHLKNYDTEKMPQTKLQRNIMLNKVDSYLKKFNNEAIMNEYYERLKNAIKDATINGKIHKYQQFLNEIRVVQEYLGIRENISEKLAEDFINQCFEVGEDLAQ